ncbi:MAG: VWA domain-containing protein [Planctomycetaceae bacterium]|jgi:uncharacterized protein YegL|nr:VWA domain-containing protein [Planctomycetaceae bacterium]
MHPLPVYILIDTSSEMIGTLFVATLSALDNIASSLNDVAAHNDISLCLIEFNSTATVLRPLSPWKNSDLMPQLVQSQENVDVDCGLEKLCECCNQNKSKDSNAPILILITSGKKPSETQLKELKKCGFGKILILCNESTILDDVYRSITFDIEQFGQTDTNFFRNFLDSCFGCSVPDIYDVYRQGWELRGDEKLKDLKRAYELGTEKLAEKRNQADKLVENAESRIREEQQECDDRVHEAERKVVEAEEARVKAEETRVKAEEDRTKAYSAKAQAKWNMTAAIVTAACVVFIAVCFALYCRNSVATANRLATNADSKAKERIIAAQTEAAQKVSAAKTLVTETKEKTQQEIRQAKAAAEKEKNTAIQKAEDDAQATIKQKSQELQEEYENQVAVLKTKENELDTREKTLQSNEKTLVSDRKKIEEQARRNKEREKELVVEIQAQKDATALAYHSKEIYEDHLKTQGVDIAEFYDFIKNRDALAGLITPPRREGKNQQIPVKGGELPSVKSPRVESMVSKSEVPKNTVAPPGLGGDGRDVPQNNARDNAETLQGADLSREVELRIQPEALYKLGMYYAIGMYYAKGKGGVQRDHLEKAKEYLRTAVNQRHYERLP